MRKKIFAGLVGLIGTALIAGACNIKFDNKGKTITPKGDAITETRNIGTFDKIDVEDAFNIHYKAGIPTDGLTIEAAPNLMEYIVTEVTDGELSIRLKDRYSIHDGKIVITVGSPTLKAVEMSRFHTCPELCTPAQAPDLPRGEWRRRYRRRQAGNCLRR